MQCIHKEETVNTVARGVVNHKGENYVCDAAFPADSTRLGWNTLVDGYNSSRIIFQKGLQMQVVNLWKQAVLLICIRFPLLKEAKTYTT